MDMKIYDHICRRAKDAGLSINLIEKECGLGSGSVYKWNTVNPSVRSLKKVADYLGVPIEALLEDEPTPNKKS